MNFFPNSFNTSHYWYMERYNSNAYVDAFFAVGYSNDEAFSRACEAGVVFW